MVLGDNVGYRYQYPWLYQDHWSTHALSAYVGHELGGPRSLTSAWCPETAKPEVITKEPGSDCIDPHESRASSQSGAAARTTNTNMASLVLHGGPVGKVNLSPSWASVFAQSQRATKWQLRFGVCL